MSTKLFVIKLLHTAIWAVMASCVLYVVAAGIFGFFNPFVYLSVALIVGEGAILMLFGWSCPLTVVARRYTHDRADNFDIFLPRLLARHNKAIFTTLFLVGLLLLAARKVAQEML